MIFISLGRNLLRNYNGHNSQWHVTENLVVVRSYQAEESWKRLLLCQITRGTEHDNGGILLELDGAVWRRRGQSRLESTFSAAGSGSDAVSADSNRTYPAFSGSSL
jgi:hypothetical protein